MSQTTLITPATDLDRFHAHLDICSQCRNNPMGLCEVGYPLLEAAGREAAFDREIPA